MDTAVSKLNTDVVVGYEAQLAVARDRIMQFYKFHLRNGRDGLTVEEMETIQSLYDAYKKLGGNGFVDRIMKEMCHWKLIPINEVFKDPDQVKSTSALGY